IFLVTTLLDPLLYPAEQIAQAYLYRWRIELCMKDLKITLGVLFSTQTTHQKPRRPSTFYLSSSSLAQWHRKRCPRTWRAAPILTPRS
ncbi:MAG: hypothetical protein WC378_10720, partial [Opitutaceae bacterium]